MTKPNYEIILREDVLRRAEKYKRAVTNDSTVAGEFFRKVLSGKKIDTLTKEQFLELLIQTKKPLFFAKRSLKGDGRDWTSEEVAILGDICLSVDVTVFDNGAWKITDKEFEVHKVPFTATLVFVPGPLLTDERSPDFNEIVVNQNFVFDNYFEVISRRLVPAFDFIDQNQTHQKALVVLPGIGCGIFAGKFSKVLPGHLAESVRRILKDNHMIWTNIDCVVFVSFDGISSSEKIGHITFRIRPFTVHRMTMLSKPEKFQEDDENFSNHRLYKLVAWDHLSYPGNNFFRGKRETDDGVSSAATDCMSQILQIEGRYNGNGLYLPPKNYRDWEKVVFAENIKLTLDKNLYIASLRASKNSKSASKA